MLLDFPTQLLLLILEKVHLGCTSGHRFLALVGTRHLFTRFPFAASYYRVSGPNFVAVGKKMLLPVVALWGLLGCKSIPCSE